MLFLIAKILVIGFASVYCNHIEYRILGGNAARIEDNPWQVSLQYGSSFWCGGSIISERFVLSAAHCTDGRKFEKFSVRVGTSTRSKDGQVIKLANIIKHPRHKKHLKPSIYHDYDFVLLELAEPLNFTVNIKPISLPNENIVIPDGTIALASGWGHTHNPNESSEKLRAVNVLIINQSDCFKQYNTLKFTITDGMICAGFKKGGKDTCQGDSGGPLSIENDGNRVLVGVVSWGYGCGLPDLPGVYSRVSAVRSWIKSISGI